MAGLLMYVSWLRVGGIALFPFILLKKSEKGNLTLLQHERIHLKQQLELLIIPFYLFYLIHYVFNILIYRNHKNAYRNIVFEKEAFLMEATAGYLDQRKPFSFLNYL